MIKEVNVISKIKQWVDDRFGAGDGRGRAGGVRAAWGFDRRRM